MSYSELQQRRGGNAQPVALKYQLVKLFAPNVSLILLKQQDSKVVIGLQP